MATLWSTSVILHEDVDHGRDVVLVAGVHHVWEPTVSITLLARNPANILYSCWRKFTVEVMHYIMNLLIHGLMVAHVAIGTCIISIRILTFHQGVLKVYPIDISLGSWVLCIKGAEIVHLLLLYCITPISLHLLTSAYNALSLGGASH